MTELLREDTSINPVIKDRIEKIQQGIVPKGYKKTSIGIVSEEWEMSTLGNQLYKIKGGGTSKRKYKHYYNGDIPWATVKDMWEGNFKSNTLEYITREGLENSSANLIESYNLIVSTRMALGSCFINK